MKPSQTKLPTKDQIVPLWDEVFIECEEKPGASEGGVLLPDIVKQNQQDRIGTILALGPQVNEPDKDGVKPEPPLKPGDRVIVNFFDGTNVTLDLRDRAERYKLLPRKNVRALVR